MLIVSRRSTQSVVVGEFDGFQRVLKITVLEVHGGKVRLGLELIPDEEPVHLPEAWEQLAKSMRSQRN